MNSVPERRIVLGLLRLAVLAAAGLAAWSHGLPGELARPAVALLAALGASNAVPWLVRREWFEKKALFAGALLVDIGVVSVLATILGLWDEHFFSAFVLVVLAAVLSRRAWAGALVALGAMAVLAALRVHADSPEVLMDRGFLLNLSLLFALGLLAGYAAQAMEAGRYAAIQCNPTTGLPGYSLIREELERRIASGRKFAVLYIDNDNFKAYNDHYGYSKGDSLIKATGRVIVESVGKHGGPGDFVGHVGGDDFLALTTPDNVDELAREVNREFRRTVRGFYDTAALERGFIKSHDRSGITATFPVMTLSIAVVSNERRRITSPDQIAEIAAQLKKRAKSEKSRQYVTGDTAVLHIGKQLREELGGEDYEEDG
jgi:diguanylate cyclase (GGDEF)-like protein